MLLNTEPSTEITESLMQTTSPEKIVHEIAESTDNDEELVSKMYADALED